MQSRSVDDDRRGADSSILPLLLSPRVNDRWERGGLPGAAQFFTTAKIIPTLSTVELWIVMGLCKVARLKRKVEIVNVWFSFRRFLPDTGLGGIPPPAKSPNHAGGLSILRAPHQGRSTSTHATYCKYPPSMTWWRCHVLLMDRAGCKWCLQMIRLLVYFHTFSSSFDLSLLCSCGCEGGRVCSLTRDAIQQHSFVFYCRPKETSKFRWSRFL